MIHHLGYVGDFAGVERQHRAESGGRADEVVAWSVVLTSSVTPLIVVKGGVPKWLEPEAALPIVNCSMNTG